MDRIILDTSFASTIFSGCGRPCARIVDSRATTGLPDEMASLTSGRTRNNRDDVLLLLALLLLLVNTVVRVVIAMCLVEEEQVETARLRLAKDSSRLIINISQHGHGEYITTYFIEMGLFLRR